MLKTQAKVREFLEAMRMPVRNKPGTDTLRFDMLRSIVEEEAEEFDSAMEVLQETVANPMRHKQSWEHSDACIAAWASVIDAMCDLIVVIHNTSNAMGIDLEPFFDEVHRTNMAKVGGPKREDGKQLKPEGWQPPRIKEMLQHTVDGGPCLICGMNLHPMDGGWCRFCAIREENEIRARAEKAFEDVAKNPSSVAAEVRRRSKEGA